MPVTPREFKDAFDAAFLVNRKHLKWNSNSRRTSQMIAFVYQTIADSFPGLEIEYEHANIDAVLFRGNLDNIEVAIEHENDVKSIKTELTNFQKHKFPLNVLITYTGDKSEYLINRQGHIMDSIEGDLLLITNPKNYWPNNHKLGDKIPWEYFLWTQGKLRQLL